VVAAVAAEAAGLGPALRRAGRALRLAATRHKRLERQNREAAREALDALAELRRICEGHGIRLEELEAPGVGGQPHGRNDKTEAGPAS
jgi:hypothetical protein